MLWFLSAPLLKQMFLELAVESAVTCFSSIKQKCSMQGLVMHLHGSFGGYLSSVVSYVMCMQNFFYTVSTERCSPLTYCNQLVHNFPCQLYYRQPLSSCILSDSYSTVAATGRSPKTLLIEIRQIFLYVKEVGNCRRAGHGRKFLQLRHLKSAGKYGVIGIVSSAPNSCSYSSPVCLYLST